MSVVFDSIKQGMEEAVAFAQGETQEALIHHFSEVDVKAIREQVGLSQHEFATICGISLKTLQHWEQGETKPRGPALVLLNVVAKEPEAVMRALSSTQT